MHLTPTSHAVCIGDDLVLLDVAADRYLCLPGGARLGLTADRRRLATCDAEWAADLIVQGLATPAPPTAPAALAPVLAPPVADLCRPHPGGLDGTDRRDAIHAAWDAVWRYPRQDFAALVAFAADRSPDGDPDRDPDPVMQARIHRFHAWAVWLPAPAKCLLRSFVLLRLLRRHGFDARWVFAVRTWPFEAHCWLQAGGTVLDDIPERLTAYHPILVV